TLQTHPHITQTAITTHTDHHNTPRLTAYITTTAGVELDGREVREWLRGRLPDHMVPSLIATLERMPLTPNGKLDKKALPAIELPTVAGGRAPRTPLEEKLCGLFADALAFPAPLTIDDNFFDHGGHSLLAARLASRIRTTLDAHLTIRDIFLNPTPAALAGHIEALGAGSDAAAGTPARRSRPALRRRTEAGALLGP
ncbi:phosphopantetheine-binding protein, partial [Streptomyces sp. NPDC051569]|uniref:phosphopantetheine-binding protein n=1 Tax=Streptomyces sp. NPDC051569 TaxID=3365661 RepID=UPI003796B21C